MIYLLFWCWSIPLQQLAIHEELLDPREARYVLARPSEIVPDLELLSRRYFDLRDCPRTWEAERFPSRDVLSDWCSCNRSTRRILENQQAARLHLWSEYQRAILDLDARYRVLDEARDSKCEYYYSSVRRMALQRVLTMLGPDDFHRGWLPTPVPVG